jgi:hypothetical protein
VPSRPPPNFLVIGYESHVHRSIELTSRWSDGGTILRWEWTVDSFAIAYRSLAGLVEVAAEIVSEGDLERIGKLMYVREETERPKQLARLEAAGPHPLYGDATEIAGDLRSWPPHWLEASGIDLRDREPLGATHTIAELVHAAEYGPVRGRIAGRVIRLAGTGAGSMVLVDDGTRELDVWCPDGTSPWGPVMGERFELEVTIEGPVEAPLDFDAGHAEVQRHALAGRVEEAQKAAEAFLGRIAEHRAPAVATDIRPLD